MSKIQWAWKQAAEGRQTSPAAEQDVAHTGATEEGEPRRNAAQVQSHIDLKAEPRLSGTKVS